ncbi:MAG: phenylalanine--tRNA ligase subunit beta [Thermotogaceae bacterium]|nr:phenylalanine--tRNA ligase subunit beta [Thermotogaceae bacterium]
MKISREWLSDYVDVPENVEDILTNLGLNVDEVISSPVKGKIVVGKVVEVNPHPDADKLNVCTVDVGDEKLNIITADKNVRENAYVAVALPGTILSNGREIKAVDMRGIMSEGMMCSLEELGIEEHSDNVYTFDFDAEIGRDVIELFNLNDVVYDIEITPNRGDALSYTGISREIAAKTKQDVVYPAADVKSDVTKTEELVKIRIEDVEGCPRYAAMVIRGVTVKESPVWLKRRLMASGIRPVNNIVDATNYVMLETGHPIHAFDYNLITTREIVVRKAKKGEKAVLLDEKEYEFSGIETLITDGGKNIIAVGGVMGAHNSGISDNTKDVLIEVAFFDPVRIRRTAKVLGIQSDASYRFERGVDPNDVEYVMKRVVSLIQLLAGGTATKDILDVYEKKIDPIKVQLKKGKIEHILGIRVPDGEVVDILERLGFSVEKTEHGWNVTVPTYRIYDIQREIDLIEEVGRIYGYDKISSQRTLIWSGIGGLNEKQKLRREIVEIMKGMGFDEVLTFSFTSSKKVGEWNFSDRETLTVSNPITDDLDVMRKSLLYTLIDVASFNFTHQVRSAKIFEIGKVFWKDGEELREEEMLGAVAYGRENEEDYTDKRQVGFYTFKGVVDELLERFGIKAGYERVEISGFVPSRTTKITAGDVEIGFIGMVDPDFAKRYDIKADVYYFELGINKIEYLKESKPKYRPSPVFPSIKRDVALLIGKDVQSIKIMERIKELGKELVEGVKVIDVYKGKGVDEDKMSVTFSITFRSDERTLKDEEVNDLFEKIISRIEEEFGVKRRF